MLTRNQYLLLKLEEELIEAAHRVSKAIRFGLDEVQDGQIQTNAQRIEDELTDALTMVEMLDGKLHLRLDGGYSRRSKVEDWYQYSVHRGEVEQCEESINWLKARCPERFERLRERLEKC